MSEITPPNHQSQKSTAESKLVSNSGKYHIPQRRSKGSSEPKNFRNVKPPTSPPHSASQSVWLAYYKAYQQYVDFSPPSEVNKSHPCGLCKLPFPSRNQLFKHLKAAHPKTPPIVNKAPSKSSLRKQKRSDYARIAQLESEIQMAKLNASLVETTLTPETRHISSLPKGVSIRKKDSQPGVTSFKRVKFLPVASHFESSAIPGYKKYDYVSSPHKNQSCPPEGFVTEILPELIDDPEVTTHPRSMARTISAPVTTSQPEAVPTTFVVYGNKVISNLTPEQVRQYNESDALAQVRLASSWLALQASQRLQAITAELRSKYSKAPNVPHLKSTFEYEAGSFLSSPPPTHSEFAGQETSHARRESIFSRPGDDLLFDSEEEDNDQDLSFLDALEGYE